MFKRLKTLINWARTLSRLWIINRPDSTRVIQLRQKLIIPVFLAVLIWSFIDPTPVAIMGVVAIGLLIGFAYWWARQMAEAVSGSRKLRSTALQVGDEFEEDIKLENSSYFPIIWAEFIDRSSIPGYHVSAVRAVGIKETAQWRIRATCSRRGVFILGDWDLILGDPFNFFTIRHAYQAKTEIVVYPPLAVLPADLLPESKTIGDQRAFNQPLFAETTNAVTVRPFVPGDSLRHVHWRTSARMDSLFVKVFAPEAYSSVWLIPDLDASAQSGEGSESTLEKMIILAATLTNKLLNDRMSVGLLAYADPIQVVKPQRGQPHFWKILRTLASLQASPSQPLTHTLLQASSMVTGRDSLIIMTPSVRTDWIPVLKRLDQKKPFSRITTILLDASARGEPEGIREVYNRLAEQAVPATILNCDDIHPISAVYGKLRRWEFITFGTGRAIVREKPREV